MVDRAFGALHLAGEEWPLCAFSADAEKVGLRCTTPSALVESRSFPEMADASHAGGVTVWGTGAIMELPMEIWTREAYRELRGAVSRRDPVEPARLLASHSAIDVAHLLAGWLLDRIAAGDEAAGRIASDLADVLADSDWIGDRELADRLRHALGVGPDPGLRHTPVDLEILAMSLDSGHMDPGGRLDIETGEVWSHDPVGMNGIPLPDHWEDPSRWAEIWPWGPHEGWLDMKRFIATQADEGLADRLREAIRGRGAFRRFKDIVYSHPDTATAWNVFNDDRQLARVPGWLAEHGLRPD